MRTLIEGLNRKLLGANSLLHPNALSARGISQRRWQKFQLEHELNYWVHEYPNQVPKNTDRDSYYREHYWGVNRNMFRTLDGCFHGARVIDVGCGPYGSMDYAGAESIIGIDPLAFEYQRHYSIDQGIIVLNALAEAIPLLDGTADVVISVNALDHMYKPYQALEEMFRICRQGGHFILATDVGGTPRHPCKILQEDLDAFVCDKSLETIEHDCGTHIASGWPAAMEVPLFVFHGLKQ